MRAALVGCVGGAVLAACGFHGSGVGPDSGTEGDAGSGSGARDAAPDGPLQPGDWWNAAWMYRRPIDVTSAHVTAALADFPVLVEIPKQFAWNHARADGSDLRFIADDGSALPYAIDTFAPSGTTSLWVKLTLDPVAHPTATRIWLYYGNPNGLPVADDGAVFGGETSVHHLGDALADASGHAHDGTAENVTVAPKLPLPAGAAAAKYKAGIVGDGLDLDATYGVQLAGEPDYRFTTQMSASVWFQTAPFTQDWQALLTKGDHAWRLARDGGAQDLAYSTSIDSSDVTPDNLGTVTVVTTGATWHYFGVSYDAGVKVAVYDGVPVTARAFAGPIFAPNPGTAVAIGDNLDRGQRRWKGAIDEVRIAETPRSVAWLVNEYATIADPAYATLGAEETR